MALTILKALKFGGLFGSTVVAGKEGLQSPVESVSVLEIADQSIADWVEPNQLYITSFYAIYNDVPKQLIVIRILKESGCCGLVLCNVGMLLSQIDPEVIALCDELKFPLIQARANVSYIELMTPILEALHDERTLIGANNNYSIIRNDFLNLIVNEDNTDQILKQFNRKMGRVISYYDIYTNCLFSGEVEEELREEEEFLRENFNHILYRCSQKGYAFETVENKKKLFVLIRSAKNLFGVFVTAAEDLPESLEEDFIRPLEAACTLLFSKRDRITDYQKKAEQDFGADLLVWNFPSKDNAIERGLEIGWDIRKTRRVILINMNAMHFQPTGLSQRDIENYINEMLVPNAKRYIRSLSQNNWLFSRSDTVIVFVDESGALFDMKELCTHLMTIFKGTMELSVSMGISKSIIDPVGIPDAYMQAFQAALTGRKYYGSGQVLEYDQIWFLQHMHELKDHSEARRAAALLIAPIKKYDNKHNSDLELTLKTLLKNGGNVAESAKQMYIHKNTVLQRKNRILEILEESPFEYPNFINYIMALDILGE